MLWYSGKPRIVFNLVLSGKVELLVSEEILEEIHEVLLRPKFKLTNSFVKEYIKEIEEITRLVYPKRKVKIVKSDPDDDRIIECALEGKAKYIISGDVHLLDLKNFEDIIILSPSDFLTLFQVT